MLHLTFNNNNQLKTGYDTLSLWSKKAALLLPEIDKIIRSVPDRLILQHYVVAQLDSTDWKMEGSIEFQSFFLYNST